MPSISDSWGTTDAEREMSYPCDDCIEGGAEAVFRAVSVRARPATVYRWLCQMRVAPYSYDWIDNLGRRSPRTLTPGIGELRLGQTVMLIFELRSFETDRHLTLELNLGSAFAAMMGPLFVSYVVEPQGMGTRLLVKLVTTSPMSLARRFLWRALVWGDLVMMRKQLLTFKELAEQMEAAGVPVES